MKKYTEHHSKMPAISVCIPNYNYAGYLAESIASVLAQDFSDFELLIQDDCSADGWEAVVGQFNDPRISVDRNGTRLGFVGNWNACIERARGELVALLHADDYFLPGMLAAEYQAFRQHPKVGLVFSATQLVDARGKPTRVLQPFPADLANAGTEFLTELLLRGNFVRTPTVMVRRECYAKLGAFSDKLSFTADWEMWLRIAAEYNVTYLAKPYAAYREHAHNATHDFRLNVRDMEAERDALDLFFREHPRHLSLRAPAYAAMAERTMEQIQVCLMEGDTAHAIQYAQLAAKLQAVAQEKTEVSPDAALEILAARAAAGLRSYRDLERWALELESEIKRRDAVRGWSQRIRLVTRAVRVGPRTERKAK